MRPGDMRVFIGVDPRQPVAAAVMNHSIQKNASMPVAVTELHLNQLPMTRRGLTEFTYSRFLCPFLCGYEGVSVFVDADMLVTGDIWELHKYANAPVNVAKHAERFEWPAVMVFNNKECETLTPHYIDDEENKLFDFAWTPDIGNIPDEWHYVVGYDAPRDDAKLWHFTQGIPEHPECREHHGAELWKSYKQSMNDSVSWLELLGRSVHAERVLQELMK